MKIDYNVEIDIEDVFEEMTISEKESFIASHLDVLGNLTNIAETWFTNEDINILAMEHVDDLPDDVIISQVIDRNLEIEYD